DAFGNVQHYFEVHKAHSELRIHSSALVECQRAPDVAALVQPWESAKPSGAAGTTELPAWEFIYPTALVPLRQEYTDYARAIFTPERPLGEALLAFNHQLHTDFQYVPGATAVDTPLAQVWENRAGVCQDFAHLAIAALRGIGLAAAYVSGYLLTYPREGESKRIGADASHAWFAVWTPEHGWIHFDPTNDTVVGDEHIVVAIGRDYSDSPPVKGVCFSGGLHQLSVAVTVNELAIDETTSGGTTLGGSNRQHSVAGAVDNPGINNPGINNTGPDNTSVADTIIADASSIKRDNTDGD
ncbi:MAG TPA: transglutaminase family protein, partial [Spongiibacteraceae bacterium]|nr:transglutaminase family protein [Spongiibacteraceae bacterium]